MNQNYIGCELPSFRLLMSRLAPLAPGPSRAWPFSRWPSRLALLAPGPRAWPFSRLALLALALAPGPSRAWPSRLALLALALAPSKVITRGGRARPVVPDERPPAELPLQPFTAFDPVAGTFGLVSAGGVLLQPTVQLHASPAVDALLGVVVDITESRVWRSTADRVRPATEPG